MSQLADLSNELRVLSRHGGELDRRLLALRSGELAQMRRQYLARSRGGAGASQARRALAALDVVERDLEASRQALALAKDTASQWLASWGAQANGATAGANADPSAGGSGAGRSMDDSSGEQIREQLRAAVQAANASLQAGSAQSAIETLTAAVAEAQTSSQSGRLALVRAWSGEREGRRNAYASELRKPQPNSTYVVLGADSHAFMFETDELGRTRRACTTLRLLDQPRAPQLQGSAREAKGGDPDDDGGHLIPHVFGGPGEEINIVPQDWFENRMGVWRGLEQQWKMLVERGEEVWVDVRPIYTDDSARPVALQIHWAHRPGSNGLWRRLKQTVDNSHLHGSRSHDPQT
jgi:hypothetical protein